MPADDKIGQSGQSSTDDIYGDGWKGVFDSEDSIVQPVDIVSGRRKVFHVVNRLSFFSYHAANAIFNILKQTTSCSGLEGLWGLSPLYNWSSGINLVHQFLELLPLSEILKKNHYLSQERFDLIRGKNKILRDAAVTLTFIVTVLNYENEIDQIKNNEWESLALQPGLFPLLAYLIDFAVNQFSFGAEQVRNYKQWIVPGMVTASNLLTNGIISATGASVVQCNPDRDGLPINENLLDIVKSGTALIASFSLPLVVPFAKTGYNAVAKKCQKEKKGNDDNYYTRIDNETLTFPDPTEDKPDSALILKKEEKLVEQSTSNSPPPLKREGSRYQSFDGPRVSGCARFMNFLKSFCKDPKPIQEEPQIVSIPTKAM